MEFKEYFPILLKDLHLNYGPIQIVLEIISINIHQYKFIVDTIITILKNTKEYMYWVILDSCISLFPLIFIDEISNNLIYLMTHTIDWKEIVSGLSDEDKSNEIYTNNWPMQLIKKWSKYLSLTIYTECLDIIKRKHKTIHLIEKMNNISNKPSKQEVINIKENELKVALNTLQSSINRKKKSKLIHQENNLILTIKNEGISNSKLKPLLDIEQYGYN